MIHCKSGNSRAAVVSMGYLMHHLDLSFRDAYWLVKKSRPSINPQEGFLEQLVQYEFFLSKRKGITQEAQRREREQSLLERQVQRQMDLDMGLLDDDDEGKGKEKETEREATHSEEGEEREEEEGDDDSDAEGEAKRRLFLAQVYRVHSKVPPLVDLVLKQTSVQLASYLTNRIQNALWDGNIPLSFCTALSSFIVFPLKNCRILVRH